MYVGDGVYTCESGWVWEGEGWAPSTGSGYAESASSSLPACLTPGARTHAQCVLAGQAGDSDCGCHVASGFS